MLDFFADIISKNMHYIQLWQRRAPLSVTTGVRLPYFTDGKSNSYYHIMTEPTFTLSPTRTIKTRMPVSATCPTETIITCREGKSHSPLYAAHSIREVSKLSLPPAGMSWSHPCTFNFTKINQESLIYFKINIASTLRDLSSLLNTWFAISSPHSSSVRLRCCFFP